MYPAKDGNPPKYAVNRFSLAVPKGECFGILGPNDVGKTSSINMVTRLNPLSSLRYYDLASWIADDLVFEAIIWYCLHSRMLGYLPPAKSISRNILGFAHVVGDFI
jgi:ABC-type lipopolysaccharide export system ATPase subunit